MWWVRPSIVVQNPSTPSFTAACPMAGSMLAKRNRTSGVRCEMNLSAFMPSMSAKMGATSRLTVHSLVGVGSELARKVSGGGVPHRCGGTSQSPATQQSSIWSMSENHSIHEPHGSGL